MIAEIKNLLKEGKYKKVLSKVNSSKVKDIDSKCRLNLIKGLALTGLGKHQQAVTSWEMALKQSLNDTNKLDALKLLSQGYIRTGRNRNAENMLEQVFLIDDSYSVAEERNAYATLLLLRGAYSNAIEVAEKNLALDKYYASAMRVICEAKKSSLDRVGAMQYLEKFERQLKALPIDNAYFVFECYIGLNAFDNSQRVIELLMPNNSGQNWFNQLLGIQCYHMKDYAKALEHLEQLDFSKSPLWLPDTTTTILDYKAKCHEKLGNYEASYEHFAKMANLAKDKAKKISRVDYTKEYSNLDLSKLTQCKQSVEQSMVFMVGFPRSGTTLLETILDTHPDIVSLSEPRTISEVRSHLAREGFNYPHCLQKLSEDAVNDLRRVYLTNLKETPGYSSSAKVVVDKMPINTVHLPLIKILFPEAKYIFNLRHPLDVVYSNFQQNYRLNGEMAFLTTIDETAKRYAQVFDFYEVVKKKISLDVLEVRYEDLVKDIDHEYERLMSFLKLDKGLEYKNFHQHAQSKVLNTSSKHQVSKPLYNTSKYKWKNYSNHLEHIIPKLQRFIDRFGYNES